MTDYQGLLALKAPDFLLAKLEIVDAISDGLTTERALAWLRLSGPSSWCGAAVDPLLYLERWMTRNFATGPQLTSCQSKATAFFLSTDAKACRRVVITFLWVKVPKGFPVKVPAIQLCVPASESAPVT